MGLAPLGRLLDIVWLAVLSANSFRAVSVCDYLRIVPPEQFAHFSVTQLGHRAGYVRSHRLPVPPFVAQGVDG